MSQLSDPNTYKNDKELFGLARRIAMERYPDRAQWLPFKDEITAGQHPQLVHDYRVRIVSEQVAGFEKRNAAIAVAKSLQCPNGLTLTVVEDQDDIHLAAPWDGYDLAPRLKRLGGRWDRDSKTWVIPVESASSLKRVFANWQKSQGQKAEAEAKAKAERSSQKAAAQRQREARWAAERESDRQAYAAQKAAQAKAVAQRVLVEAGTHKIGDVLDGSTITGFGKSWTEANLRHGQLYQPCDWGRCDGEPVCVMCEKCAKHCACSGQTTYCYAYFS
jgi:hypothetical protein